MENPAPPNYVTPKKRQGVRRKTGVAPVSIFQARGKVGDTRVTPVLRLMGIPCEQISGYLGKFGEIWRNNFGEITVEQN
jgi:hypothetical protein